MSAHSLPQPKSMRGFRYFLAPALAFLLTFALFGAGSAAPVLINLKISGSMIAEGDVKVFQVSPDDSRVVFVADRERDEVFELYSAPIHGGEVVKLSGSLPAGGDVLFGESEGFQFAGNRVIFLADGDTDEVVELYSAAITGGTRLKLNTMPVEGGDVDSFRVTPDGSRVVYRVDQNVDTQYELYSVPSIGGEAPTKLNKTLIADMDVFDYDISPNSQWVIYTSDQDTNNRSELYRITPAGMNMGKLNPDLTIGNSIFHFKITPDSLAVVFESNQNPAHTTDLYGTTIDPPLETPVKYSSLPSTDRYVSSFAIAPVTERVVFLADQDNPGVQELYSNSILGGDLHKINTPLIPGPNFDIHEFKITPNGEGVVYTEYQGEFPDEVHVLYSRYLELHAHPGGPFMLNDPLPVGARGPDSFDISNGSLGVVYIADQQAPDVYELFGVPITGSAGDNIKLNGTLWVDGDVNHFEVMPDPAWVLYTAREPGYNRELYLNSTSGGALVKISGSCATLCEVDDFSATSDSQAVVYTSSQEIVNKLELYVTYLGYKVHLPINNR